MRDGVSRAEGSASLQPAPGWDREDADVTLVWRESSLGNPAPVALLSTSPEREDTILMQNPFEA